jgi:hypothetical protein
LNVQAHLLALALGAAIGLSSGLPSAALAQAQNQAQNNAPQKGAQLTGAPIGDWRGGPVTDPNGKFAYCVAENRFDNKLALVIARNPNGETNLAIGIPGAGMAQGTKFPMSVRVDETVKRNLTGIAVEPDLLVVSTGKDDELFESMRKGSRLIMQGPTDTAIFQLRGTGKALGDLRTCAQTAGASGVTKPAGPGAQGGQGGQGGQKPVAVVLPDTLRAILNAAGLREAVPLSMANIPEDRRPADFAWKIGPVFGGVREARAPADTTFETLTTNYLDILKQRCSGEFTATPAAVESLPRVTLRTANVSCTPPEGKINVAILFYKSQGDIFTVFFHEASDADLELAKKARDGLTQVVRKLGSAQPPAAPQGQPAQPQPQPPKAN